MPDPVCVNADILVADRKVLECRLREDRQSPTPVNLAFAEIRWVEAGELARLDCPEAHRGLIERVGRREIDPGRDDA